MEMDKRFLGNTLLVIGLVVALASLLADSIGVGDHPGFGRDQLAGLIVGIIAIVAGLYLKGTADEDDIPG